MIRLTREQVRRVDQICIEEYGLPGIVLMENAARSAADVAMEMIGRSDAGPVAIFCGGGNNGGDGLAIARHLHNRGVRVGIVQCWRRPLSGDAAVNWRVIERMGIPAFSLYADGDWDQEWLDGAAVVIDSIFGTGLSEPPRDDFAAIVERLHSWQNKVLAIDLPSGLDCDTGEPLGDACVRATRTVTFVAEKLGFANSRSRAFTGDVVVGDIGCPREVIDRVARPS